MSAIKDICIPWTGLMPARTVVAGWLVLVALEKLSDGVRTSPDDTKLFGT